MRSGATCSWTLSRPRRIVSMPPPAKFDPWLANRRFGIVIDAGSSGSRLQLYSWLDARYIRDQNDLDILDALPAVEKGSKKADEWVLKVEPGQSPCSNFFIATSSSCPTLHHNYITTINIPHITHTGAPCCHFLVWANSLKARPILCPVGEAEFTLLQLNSINTTMGTHCVIHNR